MFWNSQATCLGMSLRSCGSGPVKPVKFPSNFQTAGQAQDKHTHVFTQNFIFWQLHTKAYTLERSNFSGHARARYGCGVHIGAAGDGSTCDFSQVLRAQIHYAQAPTQTATCIGFLWIRDKKAGCYLAHAYAFSCAEETTVTVPKNRKTQDKVCMRALKKSVTVSNMLVKIDKFLHLIIQRAVGKGTGAGFQ
jgi:hypothetical protein